MLLGVPLPVRNSLVLETVVLLLLPGVVEYVGVEDAEVDDS